MSDTQSHCWKCAEKGVTTPIMLPAEALEHDWGKHVVCHSCIDEYEKQEAIHTAKLFWSQICPPELNNTDIKSPIFNQDGWRQVKNQTGSMILIGKTGQCKTRCMVEFLKRRLIDKRSIHIIWPEDFKRMADKRGDEKHDWAAAMSNVEWLGLDDVFTAAISRESVADLIKDLIDMRIRKQKKTIITSQLSANDIRYDAGKYGNQTASENKRMEAIIRRIKEKFAIIDFDPPKPDGGF
jgi:hypothetical protein